MPPDAGSPSLRADAGFSFIELIVGLAIMVMIATVVTPVLVSVLDKARVDTAKGSLQGFSDAIDAFEADVMEHPGYLHQLVTQIETTDANLCGNYYKSGPGKGGTAEWMGPYLDRTIPSNGRIPIGIGEARDQLAREGDKTLAGYLIIFVDEVSLEDAELLDIQFDGQDGPAGGAIRWDTPVTGAYLTLKFYKPSPRC